MSQVNERKMTGEKSSTPKFSQKVCSCLTNCIHHGLRDLQKIPNRMDDDEMKKVISDIADAVAEIRIDFIDKDFDHTIVLNPFIRVHICCEESGRYITAIKNENVPYAPRTIREKRVFVEPRGRTDLSGTNYSIDNEMFIKDQEERTFIWDDQIVISESYARILDKSTIFLFEVLDNRSTNQVPTHLIESDCIKHVAWGFLKPLSRQGRCNVGEEKDELRECRLQLFKYQHNSILVRRQAKYMDLWSNVHAPLVFLQYLRVNRIPIDPSLFIKVGPTLLNDPQEETSDDFENKLEEGKTNENDDISVEDSNDTLSKVRRFERQHHEKCLIPENLLHKIGTSGSVAMKFSHSGDFLAIATKAFRVCVYEVVSGKAIFTSSQCHNEEITCLEWCCKDIHLSSSSLDGTIVIHRFGDAFGRNGKVIDVKDVYRITLSLPSPSYPALLTFVPSLNFDDEEEVNMAPFLISASSCSLMMWDTAKEQFAGILSGTRHHTACITAITTERRNGRIYSGDAQGCIIIWKLRNRGNMNSLDGEDYEVLHSIDGLTELNGRSIEGLNLSIAAGQKQLLVTISGRTNNLFLYDFSTQTMSTFCLESKMNKMRFTSATFSPDGNLMLGGTENGRVVLMDSSGISRKSKMDEAKLQFEVNTVHWNPSLHMVAVSYKGDVPVLLYTCNKDT